MALTSAKIHHLPPGALHSPHIEVFITVSHSVGGARTSEPRPTAPNNIRVELNTTMAGVHTMNICLFLQVTTRERTCIHNSSSVGVLIYLFGLIVKNGKVYAEEEEEMEEEDDDDNYDDDDEADEDDADEDDADEDAQTSHDDASAVPEQAFDVS